MRGRYLLSAAIAAVTITVWLHFAVSATAQETSRPQAAPNAAPAASSVTLSSGSEEVLRLSRAKLSDEVTIAFIQNGEHHYTPTASEIIYLRKEGVSDRVLTAMLNQQSRTTVAQTPPPAAAPATDDFASVPQNAAPPATAVVEPTAPASTVYVTGSTPAYYSFSDPWPYWYDSGPYYYPSFALGFAWGWGLGWGGCYSGYWNNYCHNGYYGGYHGGYYGYNNGHHESGDHNGNHYSSPYRSGGQASGARPQNGGQPGTYAASGRSAEGVNQARSATSAPGGRPTSYWSGNRNSSAVARSGQPNSLASRSSQPGAPKGQAGGQTRTWIGSANNRTSAGPSWHQGAGQPSRSSSVSRSATVERAPASPTGGWSRPGGQSGNRYAGRPASSSQRIAAGSGTSYRAGGNFVSAGGHSPVAAYGGSMNSGGSRGGGSYGGSSPAPMSSAGGFQGGGGFRGGGGGGFHR